MEMNIGLGGFVKRDGDEDRVQPDMGSEKMNRVCMRCSRAEVLDLIRERVFKIGCSLRLKVRVGCKTAGLFFFFTGRRPFRISQTCIFPFKILISSILR